MATHDDAHDSLSRSIAAQDAGERAFRDGVAREDNPHASDDPDRDWWTMGWLKGRTLARRRRPFAEAA